MATGGARVNPSSHQERIESIVYNFITDSHLRHTHIHTHIHTYLLLSLTQCLRTHRNQWLCKVSALTLSATVWCSNT